MRCYSRIQASERNLRQFSLSGNLHIAMDWTKLRGHFFSEACGADHLAYD